MTKAQKEIEDLLAQLDGDSISDQFTQASINELETALSQECKPLVLSRVELGLLMAGFMAGAKPTEENRLRFLLLASIRPKNVNSLIKKIGDLK